MARLQTWQQVWRRAGVAPCTGSGLCGVKERQRNPPHEPLYLKHRSSRYGPGCFLIAFVKLMLPSNKISLRTILPSNKVPLEEEETAESLVWGSLCGTAVTGALLSLTKQLKYSIWSDLRASRHNWDANTKQVWWCHYILFSHAKGTLACPNPVSLTEGLLFLEARKVWKRPSLPGWWRGAELLDALDASADWFPVNVIFWLAALSRF